MIGSSLDQLRRVNSRFYSVPWAPSPSGWQELRVLAGCLLTSRLIAGDSPRHVSESIKQELGVRYVLPLNRARYAIELALRALQVGPDDDVVLPSYVSQSVLIPVDRVGARPVFAEVGPSLQPFTRHARARDYISDKGRDRPSSVWELGAHRSNRKEASELRHCADR